jgi:hypothetical protein
MEEPHVTPSTAKVARFAEQLPAIVQTDDPDLQSALGLYSMAGGPARVVAMLPDDPGELDGWLEAFARLALSLRSDDAPGVAVAAAAGAVYSQPWEPAAEEPAPAEEPEPAAEPAS